MSVLAVLVLLVALLLALAGLALATGLGYLAHRRPALARPIGITLTALGVFTAVIFGIVQVLIQ
ncbi:hypothetical protein [Streptomyces sp. NPDC005017]|uniref:hypothetical protein n=1 Tax=Streptomyces sp. NPDC005017 TaxID=3364706 RepID=UPI00369F9AD3